AALRERIKELTCLYSIAQVAEQPDLPLDEVLQRIVECLPPGWQYPEIASARIVMGDRVYATPSFPEKGRGQTAEILVGGVRRGAVEVAYTGDHPRLDEGPFLKEERSLIDVVARQVALIIERKEAERASERLQGQLRHADRLATIGQLAAGVAHELNEPLNNILGLAQLASGASGVPEQVARDVDEMADLSLHAREIIRKLMLFARQVPPKKVSVDLNQAIDEACHFLESRCASSGVRLVRRLAADLPDIVADSSQLNQVLVNLVVNAIQAMPGGGTLTITTSAEADRVGLVVRDTGVGMSEEVCRQIFVPFFTTKDVDQGTGLGLAVVHGIVASHGGTIGVESRAGKGTRFDIHFPARGAGNRKGRRGQYDNARN
ncbi:MAG: sensor histidine kinase, partial [Planctomycetota bacterium]